MIDAPIFIDWFRCNELVVNSDKFQVMLLGCDSNSFLIRIDDNDITSSTSVKLLGVGCIDNKLLFNDHITEISKKATQKISALFRIRSFCVTHISCQRLTTVLLFGCSPLKLQLRK